VRCRRGRRREWEGSESHADGDDEDDTVKGKNLKDGHCHSERGGSHADHGFPPLMSIFHFSDDSKIKEGTICEIQPKST
jgi:hypothetical protein